MSSPRRRRRAVPRGGKSRKRRTIQPPAAEGQAPEPPPKAVPAKAVPPKAVPPTAVPPKAVSPKAVPPAASRGNPPPRAAKAAPPSGPEKAPTVQAPRDPNLGRVLGRCKLLACVGRGKTAAVYKARHVALDMDVAVKLLTKEASSHPQLIERFQSEARVIASLDHENIVKIQDVDSEDGEHFMVMELLDGFSILDLIQRDENVDADDALRIVRQTASGLAAAHDKGIIHRDIKPQNLLLLEDGTVKVLDFGLAATFDDSSERVGTPHYMAPETCRDGSADLGSDIYALGIVLYHLLVGRPPYAGEDLKTILRKHIAGDPLRPERDRPGVTKALGELVRTLTRSDPLLRPSAREVVDLVDGIGGETLQEKGSLSRRRAGRSRRRSSGSPALAIGLVVAAVGIVGAIVALGSGSDPASEEPGSTTTVQTPPTPATPPSRTPDPTADTDPDADPTSAEPDDPEVVAAREAREKKQREANATRDLQQIETWARENWSTDADTGRVVAKYQSHYSRYKGTDAAKEALSRSKAIRKRELHPHPDRSWDDAASIADVRRQWEANQPAMETALARHDYAGAVGFIPDAVSDRDGTLGNALRFWRQTVDAAKRMQQRLMKGIPTMEEEARTVETEGAKGPISALTFKTVTVDAADGPKTLPWADVPAARLFQMGYALIQDQDATAYGDLLAFAFVHRLADPFWNVQLDLSGMDTPASIATLMKGMEARIDARVEAGG